MKVPRRRWVSVPITLGLIAMCAVWATDRESRDEPVADAAIERPSARVLPSPSLRRAPLSRELVRRLNQEPIVARVAPAESLENALRRASLAWAYQLYDTDASILRLEVAPKRALLELQSCLAGVATTLEFLPTGGADWEGRIVGPYIDIQCE